MTRLREDGFHLRALRYGGQDGGQAKLPMPKLQGCCRAVGSVSSGFARFTRRISLLKAGAVGISEPIDWPIIPLYSAFYPFAGITEFYLYNGLREKMLKMKVLKISPPASASARIFSQILFFRKGRTAARWESEPRPSRDRAETELNRAWLAFARDCSPLLAFCREVFFAAAGLSRERGGCSESSRARNPITTNFQARVTKE
jgi:hypothetical protein